MPGERISIVDFGGGMLGALLADGRKVRAPLAWFGPLCRATPAQLANYFMHDDGYRIHWPELDFELSSSRLLRGPIFGG